MRRALLALGVFVSAACCLAADKKISELPSGSPAQATDMIPIARSGLNYRLAGSDFLFNTADLVISGAPPTFSLTNTATGGGTTTFTQTPSGTAVTGFPGSPTIDATTFQTAAPECSWSNLGCFTFLIDDKYTLTGTSYAYPMLSGVNTFLMMDGTLATGKSAYIYGDHSLVTWNATATDANSAYVIGKLGEFYAFTNSTNLANGVGVSGYGAIYNGTTGTTAAGVRAEIYIKDTANFDEAAALRVVGTGAAGDGTDATKIFKYKATEYGRSLIDQPRDTDYALELTNGMGQLITGKTGQLQLAKAAGGSKPACAVGTRGSVWYDAGAAGVPDDFSACIKDSADAYAWFAFTPKEVDCSDYLGWGAMCDSVPIDSSKQRSVALVNWPSAYNSPFYDGQLLKLTAPASPVQYPSMYVSSSSINLADVTPSGGGYVSVAGTNLNLRSQGTHYEQIVGQTTDVFKSSSGGSSSSRYQAGYFGVRVQGTAGDTQGVKVSSSATGASISVASLVGMISDFTMQSDSAVTNYAAAIVASGPTSTSAVGTDITKVYKFYAPVTTYGRNYLGQPDDAGLYAAEVVGDKGLLAGGANGQLQLSDVGSKPSCDATHRGSVWYEAGATDVADTLEVCRKDASNAYAWVSLY